MKKHTISWCLICVIVFSMVLPITVDAMEAVFRTTVPSKHTLHLTIDGQGIVTVNGSRYSKPKDFLVLRHSNPIVQIQPAKGYYIRSVTYNQENITHLFNNGEWTMPKIETDVSISVLFVKDSGNPPTGDTFNPWIMVLLMASILGLIVCILNLRKSKLI